MQFIANMWPLWLLGGILCLFLGVRKLQQNSNEMQQEVLQSFKAGEIGLPKPRAGFVPFFVVASCFAALEILAVIVNLVNLIKA
jgi:hypothetical protein